MIKLSKILDKIFKRETDLKNIKLSLPEDNSVKLRILINIANESTYYNSILPSMLIPEEKRMLHLFAQNYYTFEGDIIDGGICLGGSTDAFVQGLSNNELFEYKKIDKKIWAYELGDIKNREYIKNFIEKRTNKKVPISGNYLEITKDNLKKLPNTQMVNFIPGNILEQKFPEKIEIMFLDVCKSNEINFALQKLYSRMIPNQSILIHQDYIHGTVPWVKITMGYLKEYFEYIGSTRVNSAVWLLKKEIPQAILDINPYSTYDKDKLVEMHRAWNKCFNPIQLDLINQSIKLIETNK